MDGTRYLLSGVAAFSFCLAGCNLPGLLIRGTVDSTREFADERGTHFADPETVGPVVATATVTNEGLMYFVPDYEPLLMSAVFSNVAYGVGWLQAESAQLELDGEFDKAEKINQRSAIMFARALFYAKKLLRLRDDNFDAAITSGLDTFKLWVDEQFYTEDDVEPLVTAALAFLVSMINSEEGLAAAVDLPYARYMLERSIELDPEYEGGQATMLIGVIECTMPQAVGGRPKLGLKLMERALALENRGNHSILISMAERCAVALQDREMYVRLLMEVIESGDVEEYRLPNKLARRNAERLLKQVDEFFYD
jgi:hypothetical protein